MIVAGLVLAGGRGSRMGGAVPKPLAELGGSTLLEHVLAAMPPEVRPILLNANEEGPFRRFGLPVVADLRPGRPGPLAGLEAGAAAPAVRDAGATHLLVVPGDTPFLTATLLRSVMDGRGDRPRVARHEGRLQPAVALWPLASLSGLSDFLDAPGRHAIRDYLEETGHEAVDVEGHDPFFNVNTPSDLLDAKRRFLSS